MSKYVFLTLLFSLFSVVCFAKKQPKVKIVKTEFDLGVIDRKKTSPIREFDIEVKNTGKANLEILHVLTDCELCTKVAVPNKIVKPNKSIKLHVTYDSTKFFGGLYTKCVFITTNDPKNPEITVTFKASLR